MAALQQARLISRRTSAAAMMSGTAAQRVRLRFMDEQTAAALNNANPPGYTVLPLILSAIALLVWLTMTATFWMGLLHAA
jgi:hypothetical protein